MPRLLFRLTAPLILGALILVAFAGWSPSPAAAQDPPGLDEVRPSLVALIQVDITEAEAVELLPGVTGALLKQEGIAWVTGEGRQGGLVLYVVEDSDVTTRGERWGELTTTIKDYIAANGYADSQVTVILGGREPFSDAVVRSYRISLVGVIVVGLLMAGFCFWRFGTRSGVASVIAAVVSIPLGGALSSRLIGDFDGTLATTTLPGALGALVMVVAMMTRFGRWYEQRRGARSDGPQGSDSTDLVLQSIVECFPAPAMACGALVIPALVSEFMVPGHSAMMAVVVGAGTGLLLSVAIIPFIVSGQSAPVTDGSPKPGEVKDPLRSMIAGTDGRNFSLGLLALFAGVLLVLGLFAFSAPNGGPIQSTDLRWSSPVASAGRFLVEQGADPSESAAVVFETTKTDLGEWAASLSANPRVAWVDSASRRWVDGDEVTVTPSDLLVSPELFPGDSVESIDRYFLIVPVPSVEEPASGALREATESEPLPAPARMDLGNTSPASTGVGVLPNLTALLLLTGAAGIGLYLATGGVSVGLVAAGLQLLEGLAVLGIFNLLIPVVTEAELLTGLALVSLSAMLISLEVVEELIARPRMRWKAQAHAVDASMTMLALGLSGLFLMITANLDGGPLTARLGICLFVSSSVVAIVGVLILRPALLVQRAQFQTLARPLRVYALSGKGSRVELSSTRPGDERWQRVVKRLIEAEHRNQMSPDKESLSNLFVVDTPIYQTALRRTEAMEVGRLHTEGSAPSVVSVRVLADYFITKLEVVADHGASELVGAEGRVVGRRKGERREGMLWIVEGPEGGWLVQESISEAVESVPGPAPGPVVADLREGAADSQKPEPSDLTDVGPKAVKSGRQVGVGQSAQD